MGEIKGRGGGNERERGVIENKYLQCNGGKIKRKGARGK